eukprot:gene10315-biopygen3188
MHAYAYPYEYKGLLLDCCWITVELLQGLLRGCRRADVELQDCCGAAALLKGCCGAAGLLQEAAAGLLLEAVELLQGLRGAAGLLRGCLAAGGLLWCRRTPRGLLQGC